MERLGREESLSDLLEIISGNLEHANLVSRFFLQLFGYIMHLMRMKRRYATLDRFQCTTLNGFFGYYGDHYLSYQSSIVACCISAWYRETWSLMKAVGFQKYPKRCPLRATIMSNIVTSRQYARTEVYLRCGQHCIPTGRRSWMTGIIVALWHHCDIITLSVCWLPSM